MATIIGICGSLRRASFNASLLRTAIELAPPELVIEVASIRDFPIYDGDVEAEAGLPAAVAQLKERIATSDGLLLATPEYNGSLPGVLKNAIDWLSRPARDIPRVFGDKPVGVIGATPGPGGTRLSQNAWLSVFRVLGLRPFFGRSIFLAGSGQLFDQDGRLTDEKSRELVARYMSGLAGFINRT